MLAYPTLHHHLFLSYAFLLVLAESTTGSFQSDASVLEHLLADYDRNLPPKRNGEPAEVGITFYVNSVHGIKQQKGEVRISMILRAHWRDERLAFNTLNASKKTIKMLRPPDIWLPDIDIQNAEDFDVAGVNGLAQTFVWLDPDGSLVWSRKLIFTLRCPMKFARFPYDVQTCPINLGFYMSTADDAFFKFQDIGDDDFSDLETSEWHEFTQSVSSTINHYASGSYSSATISFSMARQSRMWFVTAILPSAMFVFVAWWGYVLDAAGPARLTLDTACVVASTVSFLRITSVMPIVAYRVWLIDYAIGCYCFNLTNVVVYGIQNYTQRLLSALHSAKEDLERQGQGESLSAKQVKIQKTLKCVSQLDYHMRWIFPLVFVIFNIAMFSGIDSYES